MATLLMTDVEGSTRLWEHDASRMAQVMSEHDEVIADVTAAGNGTLVKDRGEGDSAFAVFDRPGDAVAAAIRLQLRMHGTLTIRAAIHTGELHPGFVGPDVNRCARLRSLAHGGQTLVSGAAAVHAVLPDNAILKDLGSHRLRDLDEPMRVFQLSHPDLPDDFPPISPVRSVAHVAELAAEIQRDVSRLRAGSPSLGLSGVIELVDGAERSSFMSDVQGLFVPLAERYGEPRGATQYQIAFVCYPREGM